MAHLEVSGWCPEAIAEQVDRLKHAGAEPEVRIELRWRSAAERAQDAQDAADERRSALLRRENLKGSAKSYASRGKR